MSSILPLQWQKEIKETTNLVQFWVLILANKGETNFQIRRRTYWIVNARNRRNCFLNDWKTGSCSSFRSVLNARLTLYSKRKHISHSIAYIRSVNIVWAKCQKCVIGVDGDIAHPWSHSMCLFSHLANIVYVFGGDSMLVPDSVFTGELYQRIFWPFVVLWVVVTS